MFVLALSQEIYVYSFTYLRGLYYIYLPLKGRVFLEIHSFLIAIFSCLSKIMSILCNNISKMEEGKGHLHVFQDSWFQYGGSLKKNNIVVDDDERCESSLATSSSIGEDSDASNRSSVTSSDDTTDDASSSNSNSSPALFDLSEIMDQLPIKRGLSQFYQGKSESFTSLSRATSIEDLVKKASPFRRNMKASKSCGNGLHSYKQYTLPKATISKKPSRVVSLSSFPSKRGSFMSKQQTSSLNPLHQDLEC